ncbi:MAG TPA: zinc ABC transporter substrate-binding protein [Chthoniobacterales bacterium]
MFKRIVAAVIGATSLAVAVSAADRPVKVTATVTMVADLVRSVGGDRVEIETLMGPGVDPHLYKAAASDVSKLQQADIIFYSGLLLEGKMQDIFTNLARSKRRVYGVTEAIPLDRLLAPPEFAGHHDPHVWFDVTLWKLCLDPVVKALSEADPPNKPAYEKRADEARARMDALHAWALQKANELPPERRILVTSHDAYNYFGRAYGFQVIGLQGISTVSEAGLADIAKLTDFIKQKGIKAVFVESSVPHDTIERISSDTGAKIGGELFSDAMGTAGQMENGYDLGTYEGMVKHNLSTIVEALK